MKTPPYPFAPKSTATLQRGQFWSLPLERGLFGAGCVIGRHDRQGKVSTRSFLSGVLKWVGTQPPTADILKGVQIERCGLAHIKSITTTGGEILGHAEINFAGLPEVADDTTSEVWGFNVARVVAQRLARDPQMFIRLATNGGKHAG